VCASRSAIHKLSFLQDFDLKETFSYVSLLFRCYSNPSHKTVNHGRGEYARDEDGDGFCEVHVNTMESVWSLLRSWLRPHRGISQEKMPYYLALFEFVHNARCRGKALLGALLAALLPTTPKPE